MLKSDVVMMRLFPALSVRVYLWVLTMLRTQKPSLKT